jgi:hypothetical protein
MRVRIHETREDNFALAIDLSNSPAILLEPGIAHGIFRFADRSDLSAKAQDGGVFDDAEVFEF